MIHFWLEKTCHSCKMFSNFLVFTILIENKIPNHLSKPTQINYFQLIRLILLGRFLVYILNDYIYLYVMVLEFKNIDKN